MGNRPYIHVIADDLTGSADAANYFRTTEYRVRVTFSRERVWDFGLDALVVQVYDAETRPLVSEEAAHLVEEACVEIRSNRPDALVYKKVDSTLRGNIGAEIEAALLGLDRKVAVVAPSFPANGRTVQDSILYVDGVPVDETAFAADPRHPIHQRDVREHIRQGSSVQVCQLALAEIRLGSAEVSRVLATWAAQSERVIVVADAQTDEDLRVLANAVGKNPQYLPCGSAGFAEALAPVWLDAGFSPPSRGYLHPVRRVMAVVGSANQAAHEQTQTLTKSPSVDSVVVNPLSLSDQQLREAEFAAARQRLNASTASVVVLSLGEERVNLQAGQPPLAAMLAKLGADVISQWIQNKGDRFAVLATGGDTALALCEQLGVSAIWPQGELFPGVPWSTFEVCGTLVPLVSKAGGFGTQTVLQDAVNTLLALHDVEEKDIG
ncbi:hypothetical protein LLE49_25345 [Alicyclobacillus tolerans]|uniref:four-carbon acid sugar kinase family protein n=1 Tax=Alicyclobacillus tolerans TaxID=90970 RepID=UPI001F23FB26|nr:four-carbon acid sugar kinase family protein [Alicyclobacillus tolerans]MCF8568054.1 hypothetical protein [Alicyclobacillus tolerans]